MDDLVFGGIFTDALPGAVGALVAFTPTAEIVGSEDCWFRALIDFRPIALTYGGDPLIGHKLIEMIAGTLFGHAIDNASSASRQ